MKRKIPVFRVSAPPGASYSQLTEIPEVRNAVINETIIAIKEGIKTNKKSISLFEVAGSDCYIELKKDKWKSSLENAINYYLESEDYNKCIECRDLIGKL
jgi:hypothetical protein